MSKTLVVMQPTYLPYPGYFNLINQSDVFVFLDDVQFSNQSWQQRNRIKTPRGWEWLTVPVVHSDKQLIRDVEIDNKTKWNLKHLKTIKANYSRCDYYLDYLGLFGEFFSRQYKYLNELNRNFISMICLLLDVKLDYYISSRMNYMGDRIQRLINMCKYHNCDTYISTIGTKVYLDRYIPLFNEMGVDVVYNDYCTPIYKQQFNGWIENLSIVDMLFNIGPKSIEFVCGDMI